VVQTSEDPYAINSRLLGHKIVGGFPLKKFYPEFGNAALWCCTELTTRSMIDTAVGLVAESEHSERTSEQGSEQGSERSKDPEPEEVAR
jgi:glycine dehydrogenase subunit 1